MIHGSKVVTLCISRLHDTENARFVELLNKHLRDNGCTLWIYNITTDLYWDESMSSSETSVFDLIDFHVTDVLIIMEEKIKSKAVTAKLISRAHMYHVPVIVVDGSAEDAATVRYDYARGFEQIVRHVIDVHGARQLHFMGGSPGNPFSEERLKVFRKILAEKGLPFNNKSVSYGYFWAKPAKAATEELIRSGSLPDAVVCATDIMAINAASVLLEHGYRIPEDIIVTGFDGIDEILFSTPTITSARCGTTGFATAVYQAAIDCLQYGQTTREYLVEPSLLLHVSCGCNCEAAGSSPERLHSFNDRFYRYQDDNRTLALMSERLQKSHSLLEASWALYDPTLQDMCCIIDNRCGDDTINLLEVGETCPSEDDTMLLFFDTDEEKFVQRPFQKNQIIPDLERHINEGYPLIFNSMTFMNVPLGYCCFYFRDYELTDYCKLPQIITMLSFGIGGFITRQYQRYLMRRIEEIYQYDALTGLHNRISFNKAFEALKIRHSDEPTPVTIILADLDGLKRINDNYGHAAGDQAIEAVAHALQNSCPSGTLCVRFGGDEMIAVVPGEYDTQQLDAQIRTTLEKFNKASGLPFPVSTSLGIHTTMLTEELDLEKMLKFADADLYQEKQRKKRILS